MSDEACPSPTPSAGNNRARILREALLIAVLAGAAAGWFAWQEQRERTLPLDLDGWGALIQRQKSADDSLAGRLAALFSAPSLWKGPYVPFVFGLCYFFFPFDEVVLVLNAVVFGLAAGIHYATYCAMGARRWLAALAVLLWILYLPNWFLFGYYYAEPFLGLSVALTLAAAAWAVTGKKPGRVFAVGAAAAALLLAKAAFLLAVGLLVFFLVLQFPGRRLAVLGYFGLGFALVYAPWPVGNYLIYGEFVPFTVEGGKVVFEGSYVPGDDMPMNDLRKIPEFVELEKDEAGKSFFEKDRYWRQLAMKQIKDDPASQITLVARKILRFWVYLPQHSWLPTWKSFAVAVMVVPLAVVGFWVNRRAPLAQLCALWVGGLWCFHGLLRSELRYNFPILPLAMLLALAGALWLLSLTPLRRSTTACDISAGS